MRDEGELGSEDGGEAQTGVEDLCRVLKQESKMTEASFEEDIPAPECVGWGLEKLVAGSPGKSL